MCLHLLEDFRTGVTTTLLSGSGHVAEEIYGNNKKLWVEWWHGGSRRDVEAQK
jgi:hypothetical protein